MLRLLHPVRAIAITVLLAALLGSFGGVAPVGAINFSIGVNGASIFLNGPFPDGSVELIVNCDQTATAECQLYATKNGLPIASEALVANVHGHIGRGITIGHPAEPGLRFPINDGCFNFRLYSPTDHSLAGFLVGNDFGNAGVCTNVASGNAPVFGPITGQPGGGTPGFSTGQPALDVTPTAVASPTLAETLTFDSGYANNTDVAQLYVAQATGGSFDSSVTPGSTACTDPAFAGATFGSAVLESQDASETNSNFIPLGGGPYRYQLYSGTDHTTPIGAARCSYTQPYLVYASPTGKLFFNTGFSGANGLICVYGASIPGSSAANQTAFTYNSFGYNPGGTAVPFQGAGAGMNTYTLRRGVATTASGVPTADACTTGTVVTTTATTT